MLSDHEAWGIRAGILLKITHRRYRASGEKTNLSGRLKGALAFLMLLFSVNRDRYCRVERPKSYPKSLSSSEPNTVSRGPVSGGFNLVQKGASYSQLLASPLPQLVALVNIKRPLPAKYEAASQSSLPLFSGL